MSPDRRLPLPCGYSASDARPFPRGGGRIGERQPAWNAEYTSRTTQQLGAKMDLLSTRTTGFATVVGLIGQFLDGRRDRATQDYEQFKAWLAENRHEEIIKLLEQNVATTVGIKALLTRDRAFLTECLVRLDRNLAAIASDMQGFAAVAEAMRPEARLSADALSFLRDFDRSGAPQVIEFNAANGRFLVPVGGISGAKIEHGDPRFFEDDVRQLLEAGLLRLGQGPNGTRAFFLTRQASALVRSLGG